MKKPNLDVPIDLQSKSDSGNTHSQVLTFYVKTYGCQMNIADSDFISAYLGSAGHKPTSNPEKADIILLNTCTVRQHAEERALSHVGRLKKLKIKNPELKIIVVGCVASRLKDKLKKRFKYIDTVIPAYDIKKIPKILSNSCGPRKLNDYNLKSRFVTISRGCSNYCSYCIVPYVRGEEIGRPEKEILSEVELCISNGFTEITLLGQNVNSYKFKNIDFSDLLKKINMYNNIKRINFLTSHPKDLSDRIITTIRDCEKISREIHLPVQSGSDRILKLMNRHYTKEKYLNLIKKMQSEIPGVSFSTDIIVGFPSETEKDFNETLGLVKKVRFSKAFTFKYSPRENTKAYKLTDDVPLNIKEQRLAKLNTLLKNSKTQELKNPPLKLRRAGCI